MVLFEQSIGDKELEPSSYMWVFKGVTAPTQDFSLIRTGVVHVDVYGAQKNPDRMAMCVTVFTLGLCACRINL